MAQAGYYAVKGLTLPCIRVSKPCTRESHTRCMPVLQVPRALTGCSWRSMMDAVIARVMVAAGNLETLESVRRAARYLHQRRAS
jgi:hypothetical protein